MPVQGCLEEKSQFAATKPIPVIDRPSHSSEASLDSSLRWNDFEARFYL